MKKQIFKLSTNYILYIILIISFVHTYSLSNVTQLKIGIKNMFIKVEENQTIYKINTNYLNLNISITDLRDIVYVKISGFSDNLEREFNNNCSNSSKYCHCNFLYI